MNRLAMATDIIKIKANRRAPCSLNRANKAPPSQVAKRNGMVRKVALNPSDRVIAPATANITTPIIEIAVTKIVRFARVTATGSGPDRR